jgi:glucose-1-phosphate thymidylyltransferase
MGPNSAVRIVGVIPAAGHATRLQPLVGSKEVVAVNGRPAMDYLYDRMRQAGYTSLRVVTRQEKGDVVRHARDLGAEVVLGYPATLADSLRLGIEGLAPADVVLFGFPDSVWTPLDGFVRLREALETGDAGVVLGLFQTRHPERSEVVSFRPDGTVTGIAFKPARPTSNWIWGCLAARADQLGGLERFAEPGNFLDELCRSQSVRGVRLGAYLDIGTREALRSAAMDPLLANQRPYRS